jgi:hypothetical protein
MQANRQNTRVLAPNAPELMEWVPTSNREWSLINYGPGTLWFSYSSDVIADVGREDCTRLEPGVSFNQLAPRKTLMQVSLAAEGELLTYCLDTNWRFAGTGGPGGPGGGGGIEEAPVDGLYYARRNQAWEESAGKVEIVGKVDKAGDIMNGNLLFLAGAGLDFDHADAATFIRFLRTSMPHWYIGYQYPLIPQNDFGIFRFDSGGSFVDAPLVISKATGALTVKGVIGEYFGTTAGDPIVPDHLTRKAYVDGLFPPGGFVRKLGDTISGGLVIRQTVAAAFLDLDGTGIANINPELRFSSDGSARWSILSHVGTILPEGAGFYLFRTNGGSILDYPFFVSYADGFIKVNRIFVRVTDPIQDDELVSKAYVDSRIPDISGKLDKAGGIMTGGLTMRDGNFDIQRVNASPVWSDQHMVLAHCTPGMNQTDTAGEAAITFLNYNIVPNGGLRWGRLSLSRSDPQFELRDGGTQTPIDLRARGVIGDSVDPLTDDHLTRKAYVDRRDSEAAAGPIQTIAAAGTGWAGTPTLTYRLLNNSQNVQIVGLLQRTNGNFWAPNTQGLICTLPIGFRPINQQIQFIGAQGGQITDPDQAIQYGMLVLGSDGQLLFFGHAGYDTPEPANTIRHTASIFVNNIFSLVM